MGWTIKVSKVAAKQLKKFDKPAQKQIFNFLSSKVEGITNPRSHGKALKGQQGELWRYRTGDYRIICRLEDQEITVLVLAVAHRKNIYKKYLT